MYDSVLPGDNENEGVAMRPECGIYTYWEGPRHWYYDLCWETVLRWNPGAQEFGPQEVEEVIGPLPQAVQDAYVTHRVDWIRKKWIQAVGGLYLDHDFVCWSDLRPIACAAPAFDYIGWKEWQGTGWMDNFFAARKDSHVLQTAADYALTQMQRHGRGMQWLAASAHAMNFALNVKHRWCKYIELSPHLISPVAVVDRNFFLAKIDRDINEYISFGQMTSYHGIRDFVEEHFKTPQELIDSDIHLGAIFRRAFGL
jgi:hypothetical protein